jgi:alpha-mannosidase
MIADKIDLVHAGPDFGEFVSHGVLLDDEGRPVAAFRQSTRLARGADLVEIKLTLEPQQLPRGSAWSEYYCARFAWADAACDLRRSVGGSSHASSLDRLEAPHFIELLGDDGSTTLLTEGLPYHRRDGLRRLDTLLIVDGETEREFRFAVGLDLQSPLATALARGTPASEAQCGLAARPPAWLFHLDQPGLSATGWAPLVEEGRVVGLRIHLQEALGQMDTARLRSFRKLDRARMADGLGANLMNLRIEEGEAIVVEYAAHEWFIVEAWWA